LRSGSFEHVSHLPARPLGHLDARPKPRCLEPAPFPAGRWQARESNPRPMVSQTIALPTELTCWRLRPASPCDTRPRNSQRERVRRDSRARTANTTSGSRPLYDTALARDVESQNRGHKKRGPGGNANRGLEGGYGRAARISPPVSRRKTNSSNFRTDSTGERRLLEEAPVS
jgi:hypothetical protein